MCFTKLHATKVDSLNNQVKDFFFGTDYVNNCHYLEEHDVKEVTIRKNDLSIIQLNICSLISKQQELLKFINCCNKKKIDIVILSETWLTSSAERKVNVPGYDYVGVSRKHKRGGGVGFLINKEIKYKTQTDLFIDSDLFENYSIEMKAAWKNIVLGSIYRPPNTNQKDFINYI